MGTDGVENVFKNEERTLYKDEGHQTQQGRIIRKTEVRPPRSPSTMITRFYLSSSDKDRTKTEDEVDRCFPFVFCTKLLTKTPLLNNRVYRYIDIYILISITGFIESYKRKCRETRESQ